MRIALTGLLLLSLAAPLWADVLQSRIVAQLTAQGYENIEFAETDGQLTVRAVRRKLMLESVYDIASGELLSDRVSQVAAMPVAAEPAIGKQEKPPLADATVEKPVEPAASQAKTSSPEANRTVGDTTTDPAEPERDAVAASADEAAGDSPVTSGQDAGAADAPAN